MVKKEEKVISKSLDKTKYELDEVYPSDLLVVKKKHKPEIPIIPFLSFGLGSRLNFVKDTGKSDTEIAGWEGYLIRDKDAVVTEFYQKGDKIIIKAKQSTKEEKEEKKEFLNKIVKKINMDNDYNEKLFIDMLSNVFSDKQLKRLLKEDDIEILLFEGLMYLKCGDKAYRL